MLERLVVGDIAGLAESNGCLSLITNECGGILDDTVITNAGNYTYMVVNGATKHDDIKHFETIIQSEFSNKDVTFEYLGDTVQLLAVQGPGAAAAVAKLCNVDLTRMAFMTGTETTLDGIKGCRITRYVIIFPSVKSLTTTTTTNTTTTPTLRCGYTGEDGFELSMPAQHAVSIAQKLLDDDTVQPAGLGARDSLRLEAGLCLYGNDLDSSTTPVEAALGWTMGPPKSRRRLEGGFLGAEHILKNGKFKEVARKRVGIAGMKAPARDGVPILDMEGNPIGSVTSGTFSPCLKKPIAMGYVETGHSKVGTAIQLQVRGKLQAAEVSKMPFVESHYYRVAE